MNERSLLFVPGHRSDRFEAARRAGADAVVIDLEDAVAASDKPQARAAAASWLAAGGVAIVRVNAAGTREFDEDLSILDRPGVAGVMLPRAETAETVEAAHRAAPGRPVIALIESARGLWSAMEVARAPGVARLAFGALDFQCDLDIDDERDGLLHARSQLVLVSRVAGLPPPIDGVTTALDDADALARDIELARSIGFGGKLCIHPRQVAAVNLGFLPTAAEVERAHRILAFVAADGEGAARLDGRMIDRPVIERARAVVQRALRGTRPGR